MGPSGWLCEAPGCVNVALFDGEHVAVEPVVFTWLLCVATMLKLTYAPEIHTSPHVHSMKLCPEKVKPWSDIHAKMIENGAYAAMRRARCSYHASYTHLSAQHDIFLSPRNANVKECQLCQGDEET